jgi:hypothetical protein
VKVGISLAVGVAAYFTVNVVIALAIQFFNSSIFAAGSSVLLSNLPVVIIQISSGVFNRIVGVVVYVASTRVYWWMFCSPSIVRVPLGYLLRNNIPSLTYAYTTYDLVYSPAWTIALRVSMRLIFHSYGANVKTQDALVESLESYDSITADWFLEKGLKDYCAWIDLVESGPEQFFISPVPNN